MYHTFKCGRGGGEGGTGGTTFRMEQMSRKVDRKSQKNVFLVKNDEKSFKFPKSFKLA